MHRHLMGHGSLLPVDFHYVPVRWAILLMAQPLLAAVQASGAAAEEASGSSSLDTLESQIVSVPVPQSWAARGTMQLPEPLCVHGDRTGGGISSHPTLPMPTTDSLRPLSEGSQGEEGR